MKSVFHKQLLIALFCLGITACGFHLRGNLNFPSNFQHLSIYLSPDAHSFKNKLKEKLRSLHIRPHFSQEPNCYHLVIDELKFNRQIANISSSTTPRQFQLTYTVFFHLLSPEGKNLIPNGFALANRLVSMNSERLLGSNYEQDFFKEEMEDELITKILNRISPAIVYQNET